MAYATKTQRFDHLFDSDYPFRNDRYLNTQASVNVIEKDGLVKKQKDTARGQSVANRRIGDDQDAYAALFPQKTPKHLKGDPGFEDSHYFAKPKFDRRQFQKEYHDDFLVKTGAFGLGGTSKDTHTLYLEISKVRAKLLELHAKMEVLEGTVATKDDFYEHTGAALMEKIMRSEGRLHNRVQKLAIAYKREVNEHVNVIQLAMADTTSRAATTGFLSAPKEPIQALRVQMMRTNAETDHLWVQFLSLYNGRANNSAYYGKRGSLVIESLISANKEEYAIAYRIRDSYKVKVKAHKKDVEAKHKNEIDRIRGQFKANVSTPVIPLPRPRA
jgi:hypothetical protein